MRLPPLSSFERFVSFVANMLAIASFVAVVGGFW